MRNLSEVFTTSLVGRAWCACRRAMGLTALQWHARCLDPPPAMCSGLCTMSLNSCSRPWNTAWRSISTHLMHSSMDWPVLSITCLTWPPLPPAASLLLLPPVITMVTTIALMRIMGLVLILLVRRKSSGLIALPECLIFKWMLFCGILQIVVLVCGWGLTFMGFHLSVFLWTSLEMVPPCYSYYYVVLHFPFVMMDNNIVRKYGVSRALCGEVGDCSWCLFFLYVMLLFQCHLIWPFLLL